MNLAGSLANWLVVPKLVELAVFSVDGGELACEMQQLVITHAGNVLRRKMIKDLEDGKWGFSNGHKWGRGTFHTIRVKHSIR